MNNRQMALAIRALQREVNQLKADKTFLSTEDFSGEGTKADPLRVIGGTGGGGGGSSSPTATTSILTFGSTFVNTADVLTFPAGQSYHQAYAAVQRIGSGVKARVWCRADNIDSDFIMALNTTGTGGYNDFVNSMQLSYFQGNQRILRWNAGVQTVVKTTVAKYVGMLHNTDNSVKLQESADGVTWYDAAEYATINGDLYIMLSMTNGGKIYEPKLTTYA